ncbi:MAG: hypothetical protein FD180_1811 [Planctomycetota bacterium]|nr:MAG: hypothetical protein FD180_1811 [Planctomycetota bacterium]
MADVYNLHRRAREKRPLTRPAEGLAAHPLAREAAFCLDAMKGLPHADPERIGLHQKSMLPWASSCDLLGHWAKQGFGLTGNHGNRHFLLRDLLQLVSRSIAPLRVRTLAAAAGLAVVSEWPDRLTMTSFPDFVESVKALGHADLARIAEGLYDGSFDPASGPDRESALAAIRAVRVPDRGFSQPSRGISEGPDLHSGKAIIKALGLSGKVTWKEFRIRHENDSACPVSWAKGPGKKPLANAEAVRRWHVGLLRAAGVSSDPWAASPEDDRALNNPIPWGKGEVIPDGKRLDSLSIRSHPVKNVTKQARPANLDEK